MMKNFLLSSALVLGFCGTASAASTDPQGVQGVQGIPGVQGGQGAPGVQGSQGAPGVAGDSGSGTGGTGPAGPAGAAGPIGPQGLPGADSTVPGPAGSTGPPGLPGVAGPVGPASTVPGPVGAQGVPGVAGVAGIAGAVGKTGLTGPAGTGLGASITNATPDIVVAGCVVGSTACTIGTVMVLNDQSGASYDILPSDNAKLIRMTNTIATTMTITKAGSAGFGPNWSTIILPKMAATRVTAKSGTICGLPSVSLAKGQAMSIGSDNVGDYACLIGQTPIP